MSPNRLSTLFRSFLDRTRSGGNDVIQADQASLSTGGMYQLSGIPIVYHVLPNQDNGGPGKPSLTRLQAEFATNTTNKLYTIYDRQSKESIAFVTFRTSEIIEHADISVQNDCGALSTGTIREIVTSAGTTEDDDAWMFQFHVIVCESNQFSGRASTADAFAPTHPQHNVVLVDYRAMACHDDDGNFICAPNADGENVSHTRWWRSRSAVLAHEIGHLFGLFHTFQGGCSWLGKMLGGDYVADTPIHDTKVSSSCPGLLPYDKDRDIGDSSNGGSTTRTPNAFTEETCSRTCASSNSCAACCADDSTGTAGCPKYSNDPFDSLSEDVVDFPQCCANPRPIDTCGSEPGLDPLNNVMSYIPDECSHEFTVGQMVRMMAQIRMYKPYIYCSYTSTEDSSKCSNIPCGTASTSPHCIEPQF
jgi:hypothetical protein